MVRVTGVVVAAQHEKRGWRDKRTGQALSKDTAVVTLLGPGGVVIRCVKWLSEGERFDLPPVGAEFQAELVAYELTNGVGLATLK